MAKSRATGTCYVSAEPNGTPNTIDNKFVAPHAAYHIYTNSAKYGYNFLVPAPETFSPSGIWMNHRY